MTIHYTPHGAWLREVVQVEAFASWCREVLACTEPWRSEAMALKRPEVGGQLHGAAPRVWRPEDLWGKGTPNLTEYLTGELWEDGAVRRTSTILVFTENNQVKVCLSDRALNSNVFMGGETLSAAIASLEAALASGRVDWRSASRVGEKNRGR